MNLRHSLMGNGHEDVEWCPCPGWSLGRLSRNRFLRTFIGRRPEFRGHFQYTPDNRILVRPEIESARHTTPYWITSGAVSVNPNVRPHLKLVPRDGDGVQLIVCNSLGQPYENGALITLSGGILWFHSGIDPTFGFRLTANRSLVYE